MQQGAGGNSLPVIGKSCGGRLEKLYGAPSASNIRRTNESTGYNFHVRPFAIITLLDAPERLRGILDHTHSVIHSSLGYYVLVSCIPLVYTYRIAPH